VSRSRGCLWAFCLLAPAALSGCKGPPPTKIKFNDMMSEDNEKLSKAGTAVRKSLKPLLTGGADFNPSAVRGAVNDAEKLVKELQDKYEDQQLPRKSSAAADLLEKYKAFLEAEEKIVKNRLKEIVRVLNDPNEPNKAGKIDALLRAAGDDEAKAYKELNKAQSEYAKAHNFRFPGMVEGGQQYPGSGGGGQGPGGKDGGAIRGPGGGIPVGK
jgi:hypothetical protein